MEAKSPVSALPIHQTIKPAQNNPATAGKNIEIEQPKPMTFEAATHHKRTSSQAPPSTLSYRPTNFHDSKLRTINRDLQMIKNDKPHQQVVPAKRYFNTTAAVTSPKQQI